MTQLPGIRIDFKRPDKRELQQVVLEGVGEEVGNIIDRSKDNIVSLVVKDIRQAFDRNSTFRAMRRDDSELRYSLGATFLPFAAEKIVNFIVDNIEVRRTKPRIDNRVSIGIEIKVLGGTGSLTDILLSAPELQQYIKYRDSNERRGLDYEIPWLEWLLTRGDGAIIYGYQVLYGEYPKNQSRTGGAIMAVNQNKVYRVPAQHSGTPRDNFITRVLNSRFLQEGIGQDIERLLARRLK